MEITDCQSSIPGMDFFRFRGYKEFTDYYLNCEPQTKFWIRSNLPESGVFVDVGSNVGILTAVAGLTAHQGQVLSIEPTDSYKLLVDNVVSALPTHAGLIFENVAVSDFDGSRKDKIFKIWGHKPQEKIFEFKTLDTLVERAGLQRIDVIKIDTDGYELEVLRGSQKIIEQFRPTLIVEINEALATRGHTHQDLFNVLLDLKYDKAELLDGHNYVFTSNWKVGDVWPNTIKLSVNRELANSYAKLEKISECKVDKSLVSWFAEGVNYYENKDLLVVESKLETWSYALTLSLKNLNLTKNLIMEISGSMEYGSVGLASINESGDKFTSNEVIVTTAGDFKVALNVEDFKDQIVVRTVSSQPFKLMLNQIVVYVAGKKNIVPARLFATIEMSDSNEFLSENFEDHPSTDGIVDLPPSSVGYKMEQSGAHFLKEFYRRLKPERLLEIGTWEGFGTNLAINNGANKVWTLDLSQHINADYKSRYLDSSSQNYTELYKSGWMLKGEDKSITKLYGDSKTFNWDQFANGFFDLIIIDGGHDKDTVISDTLKTQKLLRSGGFMIWDDVPHFENSLNQSTEGVHEALKEILKELSMSFKLTLIKGTQLLVGIKKEF
jgi:FkbM family methyltransferase